MAGGIINFLSEQERHEHLLGREDVLTELHRLLRPGGLSQGWLLVKGSPGVGKSALLAHYLSRLQEENRRVPHHFLRRGVEDWGRPEVVRTNLVAQVEALFPEQAAPTSQPESRLREVLQRVSRHVLVPRGERLVLVVDALDEVEADTRPTNPLKLFLPHVLPRGVWVLCSSRPFYPHLTWLEAQRDGFHCIDLDHPKWSASNARALRKYWHQVAPTFVPPLPPDFVDRAVRRSGNNMLYAVKLAAWLQEQPVERRRADLLPGGLQGFLEEIWQDIQAQPQQLLERGVEALGLLATAREALPLSVLASVAGWTGKETEQQFLGIARPFLLEVPAAWTGECAWRLFHDSFRVFLLSRLGKEAVQKAHRRLAERLCGWPLNGSAGSFWRRYALRHAVTHWLEAGEQAQALALCTDLGFLATKCQESGVSSIEKELLRAANGVGGKEAAALRDLHRAIQAESHWLRKAPGALAGLLYNRLLCMRWTEERIVTGLHFSQGGLPALRLKHPVRMGGGELRTLLGHEGAAKAGVMTPDARWALSASDDHTLKLWDLQTGRARATLTGHTGAVTACALTPDGHLALSGSSDHTLKLWDLQHRDKPHTLTGHTGALTACALTPDGRLALSASVDRTLKVWNLLERRDVATLSGHKHWVTACALTSDGRLALSASHDGTLKLWDVQGPGELATLAGHRGSVSACALTPDGRLALSASEDRTLKLWDLQTREVLATLEGHEAGLTACALTEEGRLALSASHDGTLKLWDLRTRRVLASLKGHESTVAACTLSPDGRLALSASHDRTLKFWAPRVRHESTSLPRHEDWVTACALTEDGHLALSASDDHTLKLWTLQGGQRLLQATLKGHKGPVTACALTVDGKLVLSVSDDHTLRLWDLGAGRIRAKLVGHGDTVTACAMTRDGHLALSASHDGTLKLWDLQAGKELAALLGHEDWVTACAMTPDGTRALSTSHDGTLRLWDLRTRSALATLAGHEDWVTACALTPNGRLALSASDDGTLKLWDLRTLRELRTLRGHEGAVTACALTPDGAFAFSASDDRTLKLWELQEGHCRQTVYGCSGFTGLDCAQGTLCAGDKDGNVWLLEATLPTAPPESMDGEPEKAMSTATPPPPQPLFTWLHLSDIHIGHGGADHRWDQKLVLDALCKDIAAQQRQGLPPPDAILVTGDIAFSGTAPQYAAAKEWLCEVARLVGLEPRHVFTVPGNHDVNRAADKDRNLGRLVRHLREGSESLDEILAHEEDRALLTQRMAHYLDFAAEFAPTCLREPAPPHHRLFWSHRLEARGGLRVRLVGLNTALLSSSEPDLGRLRLGKEPLARSFLEPPIEAHELVLVLSHHPLREGWLFDQHEAEKWLNSRAHVHLSGHVHAAGLEEARSGAGRGLVRIVAGAVHEEYQPGVPLGHGYSLAAVFPGEKGALQLRVWPRKWSDRNKDFRVDVENSRQDNDFAEHELFRARAK